MDEPTLTIHEMHDGRFIHYASCRGLRCEVIWPTRLQVGFSVLNGGDESLTLHDGRIMAARAARRVA
jgi:hypothetical protein